MRLKRDFKSTVAGIILGSALEFLKKAEKDLDQRIKEQAEKERSRKLREGSIDAEFKVIDEK